MATKTKLIFEGENRTALAFAQINRSLAGMRSAVLGITGGMKGLALAIGVVKAVDFGSEVVQWQDEVTKMARGLSQPVEEFSALAGAAEFAGITMQQLRQGARNLLQNLGRGEAATVEFRDALDRLGFSVEDLQSLKSADDPGLIAARMGDVEGATDRVATLTGVFGGRAGLLFGNLVGDVEDYAGAVERARDSGFVFTDEEGRRAEALIDSMAALNQGARRLAVDGVTLSAAAIDALTDTTDEQKESADAAAAAFLTLSQNMGGVRVQARSLSEDLGLPFDIEGAEFGEELVEATRDAREPIASAIDSAIGDGAERGARGLAESLLDSIQRNFVSQAADLIAGSVGGGGGVFGFLFGGARAAGGPVSPGRAFLVGEQGPELFVPGSSGNIVPNGGGVTVNQVNNFAAGVSRAEIVAMIPVIEQRTLAAVRDEARRG